MANLNLEKGVGWTLCCIQNVLLHLWKEKSGKFGAVMHDKLLFTFARVRKDWDDTMLRGFLEIVTCNINLTIIWNGESGRSQTSLELVEHTSVVDTWWVNNHTKDAISEGLCHVENVFIRWKGDSARVGQSSVNNRFKHAHTKVNCKETSLSVLNIWLTKRTWISEKEGIFLLGEHHRVWSFQVVAIEVLNDRGNLNAHVCYSLTEDGLMGLISDEGRTLGIEDKSSWLSTGRKGDFHWSFTSHLHNVTICANSE